MLLCFCPPIIHGKGKEEQYGSLQGNGTQKTSHLVTIINQLNDKTSQNFSEVTKSTDWSSTPFLYSHSGSEKVVVESNMAQRQAEKEKMW